MNFEFESDVILSLKASISDRNARKNKIIQDKIEQEQKLKERKTKAYEKHSSDFFEQLDVFVKDTIPKSLSKDLVFVQGKTIQVNSDILPFNPLCDVCDLEQCEFVKEFCDRIHDDQKFLVKCKQLLTETGIDLSILLNEYEDEDEDEDDDEDENLKELFKFGSYRFFATMPN